MKQQYTQLGESLSINSQVRVHCCSARKTAIVSGHAKGWSFHCFRCGESFFVPSSALRKREEIVSSNYEPDRSKFIPIEDCTNAAAWAWLGKAGVSPGEAKKYGIMYCPITERVIIPTDFFRPYDKYEYSFQARSINTAGKYRSYKGAYDEKPPTFCHLPYIGPREDYPIVIVEDMLSGIRVNKFAEVYVLLGTHMSDACQAHIIKNSVNKFIIIWMDNDAAGIKAACEIYKRFYALNVITGIEHGAEDDRTDPKHYTNKEICAILYGG